MATSKQGNVPGNKQGAVAGASKQRASTAGAAKAATERTGNRQGASTRGFASMDPEQQRAIASQGGRAAHLAGTAHEFTSEEARRAGRLRGTRARPQ